MATNSFFQQFQAPQNVSGTPELPSDPYGTKRYQAENERMGILEKIQNMNQGLLRSQREQEEAKTREALENAQYQEAESKLEKANDPWQNPALMKKMMTNQYLLQTIYPMVHGDGSPINSAITQAQKALNAVTQGRTVQLSNGQVGYDYSSLSDENKQSVGNAVSSLDDAIQSIKNAGSLVLQDSNFAKQTQHFDTKTGQYVPSYEPNEEGSQILNLYSGWLKNLTAMRTALTGQGSVLEAKDAAISGPGETWFDKLVHKPLLGLEKWMGLGSRDYFIPQTSAKVFSGYANQMTQQLSNFYQMGANLGLFHPEDVPGYARTQENGGGSLLNSPDVMNKASAAIMRSKADYEKIFPLGFGVSQSYGVIAPKNMVGGFMTDDATGKKTYFLSSYGDSLPIADSINAMKPDEKNRLLGEIYNSEAKPEYNAAAQFRDWMYAWTGSFGTRYANDGRTAFLQTMKDGMNLSPNQIANAKRIASKYHSIDEILPH